MTHHVRKAYRKHPRRAALAALLAVTALVVVVALPATAANFAPTPLDIGGQQGDCAAAGSIAANEFRVPSPSNNLVSVDLATGASFTTYVSSDPKGQKLGFTSTAVRVRDVIIKGGQKSVWYDYDGNNPDTIIKEDLDNNLRAPLKDRNTYFTLSHTTFCYDLASVSGRIFEDIDGNGMQSSLTPTEPSQSNWDVTLYRPGGSVSTAKSGSAGLYGFVNLVPGAQYTICETAPANSGTWTQSVPTTSPQACSSPQESRGWTFTVASDGSIPNGDKNFGNRTTVSLACGGNTSTTGFGVHLSGACSKTGSSEYIFETWATGSATYFNIEPVTSGTGTAHMIQSLERSTIQPDPAPTAPQGKLIYNDGVGAGDREMPYCEWDPRTTATDNVTTPFDESKMSLPASFDDAASATVLPNGFKQNSSDAAAHTSCIVEAVQRPDTTAGGNDTVILTYYIYTSIDGRAWISP